MALTRAAAAGGMGGGEAAGGAILWDAPRRRFHTPDGLSYLQYQEPETGVMDMVHTYVPPSKRGGGIASHLCKAAFAHAQHRNLHVIPSCSYVADTFLPRNPEWKHLVLENKHVQ